MNLKGCLLTSVGGRKHQEDTICYAHPEGGEVIQENYLVKSFEYPLKGWFFIGVADGMGGLKAGDLISKHLCNLLVQELKKTSSFNSENIKKLLKGLQKALVEQIEKGMVDFEDAGTTLAGLLFTERSYIAFNVGDSRIYKIENGKVERLSIDHSQAAALMRKEKLPWEEVKHLRNFLYFGFGDVFETSERVWEKLTPHVEEGELKEGQRFIVCTDGFWDVLTDLGEEKYGENFSQFEEEILKELTCERLEEIYSRFKGFYRDNVTIGVVEVEKA